MPESDYQSLDYVYSLVTAMREAQRQYFRHSTLGNLVIAKAREAEVDRALREIAERRSQPLLAEGDDGPQSGGG